MCDLVITTTVIGQTTLYTETVPDQTKGTTPIDQSIIQLVIFLSSFKTDRKRAYQFTAKKIPLAQPAQTYLCDLSKSKRLCHIAGVSAYVTLLIFAHNFMHLKAHPFVSFY